MAPPDVLVIDDEKPLLKLVKVALEHESLTVATARDGAEGIECLSRDKYRVVLLDLMMPRVSGWEVIDWLKQHEDRRPYSLIVVTASDRTSLLSEMRVATTVIHGDSDRLVMPSGGRATAKAIAGARLGLLPRAIRGLQELEVGVFDGARDGDPELAAIYDAWFDGDLDRKIAGAGTGRELIHRFRLAIDRLADMHPDQTVLAVSHGGVMSMAVPRLCSNIRAMFSTTPT